MIPLLQKHKWALVPSDAILRRIKELFFLNHENAPCHRLSFLDVSSITGYQFQVLTSPKVIPFAEEYEYRFLCLNVKETPPFYIQGKRYDYPFNKPPAVWSTLHPCFAIPSAINFYERNFDVLDTSSKVDKTEALCQEISLGLNRHLFLSWVRTASTKVLGRPVPSARRDPPDSKPIVYSKVYKAFGQKQTKTVGQRKRKLSDSTTTSADDEAPPPKRRSPRFT